MFGDCRLLRVIQRVWPKHGWVMCTVMAWWYGRLWQGKLPILHIRLFRQQLELPLADWGQTFPRTAHKCWGRWWQGAGTAPLLSDLHSLKSSPFCCGQIVSDMNPPQDLLVQAMCKSTSLFSVSMSKWVKCRSGMILQLNLPGLVIFFGQHFFNSIYTFDTNMDFRSCLNWLIIYLH